MSNSNIKICVVGAGYWGKNHIRSLSELNSLGAVVESDKNQIVEIKKNYPNIDIYENIKEAIKNNDLIAFVVATPAETHFQIAFEIINARKHVLIEKPICLNEKDVNDLVELSVEKNVRLMVGHLLLFHPAIKVIKELIDSGKLGKLQYIYSNRLNLGKVRTKENAFWSLAPHDISIFQHFTNSFPNSISANGSTFLQPHIPDSTITQLKYSNGVEGHIYVSWLHPFKEHRLVVIGTNAMVTYEDSVNGKPLKLYSKKFDINDGIPEKIDGPIYNLDYPDVQPLKEELSYFIKSINDKSLKIADGQHAIEVTKILVEASNQI